MDFHDLARWAGEFLVSPDGQATLAWTVVLEGTVLGYFVDRTQARWRRKQGRKDRKR